MSPEITGEKKRLRAVAAQRSRVFEAARSNPRCWYDTNICTHLNYTLEKMQNESIYIYMYVYICMHECMCGKTRKHPNFGIHFVVDFQKRPAWFPVRRNDYVCRIVCA